MSLCQAPGGEPDAEPGALSLVISLPLPDLHLRNSKLLPHKDVNLLPCCLQMFFSPLTFQNHGGLCPPWEVPRNRVTELPLRGGLLIIAESTLKRTRLTVPQTSPALPMDGWAILSAPCFSTVSDQADSTYACSGLWKNR